MNNFDLLNKNNYYSLLEIEQTASMDDIKKAYRKLSLELHPDRNGGDIEKSNKFKQISDAYSVLSNEKKKARI